MQDFSLAPQEIAASLWRNRGLIVTSIKREVLGRYRGSVIGIFWSFFHPIFMLCVYTFVFSVVFKARWPSGSDSKTEFALILFAGLIIFNLFADCVNRAPGLILANANYVKKVIYPLEILPVITLGAALFQAVVSLLVWLLAYLLLFGLPPVTVFLLPLVLVPLLLLTLGISWGLAALGVYLRDISQFIGILTTALLFLSPIFYSITSLPANFQTIMMANPLTPIIEQSRNVLLWGVIPDFALLSWYFIVAALVAVVGFAGFQKIRKGFADVI